MNTTLYESEHLNLRSLQKGIIVILEKDM